MKAVRLSFLCTDRLCPLKKYSWYSFLLEVELAPWTIVRLEGLCKSKVPMTPSGIKPRDLLACSTVPQPNWNLWEVCKGLFTSPWCIYLYKYVLVSNILQNSIVNYSVIYWKLSSLKYSVEGNCGEVILACDSENNSLVSLSINDQSTIRIGTVN